MWASTKLLQRTLKMKCIRFLKIIMKYFALLRTKNVNSIGIVPQSESMFYIIAFGFRTQFWQNFSPWPQQKQIVFKSPWAAHVWLCKRCLAHGFNSSNLWICFDLDQKSLQLVQAVDLHGLLTNFQTTCGDHQDLLHIISLRVGTEK